MLISSEFEVKLSDFGLALVGEDGREATADKAEGTPFYMSPETFSEQEYSYEADMWAVGVLLYHLIHSAFPFRGEDKHELKDAVLNAQAKFKRSSEMKEVAEIAKILLSRDKKQRPTAEGLLKHKIFSKLEGEEDLPRRIEHKYKEYFKGKLQKKSSWK